MYLISSSVCKRESEKERGWEERRGIIMCLCKLSLVVEIECIRLVEFDEKS